MTMTMTVTMTTSTSVQATTAELALKYVNIFEWLLMKFNWPGVCVCDLSRHVAWRSSDVS